MFCSDIYYNFHSLSNHTSTHMSLFPCLLYVMEYIWLLHCKYDSQNHYAKWTYRPKIIVHIHQNITNCHRYFIQYCQICSRNKCATQMPHICQIPQLLHVQVSDNYANTYTSYKLNAIKTVTSGTAIYVFHTIGIWPWTNIPTTLHIYYPTTFILNTTYRPHITLHVTKN